MLDGLPLRVTFTPDPANVLEASTLLCHEPGFGWIGEVAEDWTFGGQSVPPCMQLLNNLYGRIPDLLT